MSKRLPQGLFRPTVITKTESGQVIKRETQVIWCRYSHNGKQYRESTRCTRVADANTFLRKRLGETGSGKFVGPAEGKTTLADLASMYEVDQRNNERKLRKSFKALEQTVRFFGGDTLARDVTGDAIARFIAFRKDEGVRKRDDQSRPRRAASRDAPRV